MKAQVPLSLVSTHVRREEVRGGERGVEGGERGGESKGVASAEEACKRVRGICIK